MTEIAEFAEQAQKMIVATFDEHEMTPAAMIWSQCGSGVALAMVAMPMMGDAEQRLQLQLMTSRDRDVVAIAVWSECWHTRATTPADIALCNELLRRGRLQDAPDHLLRSVIRLFVETRLEPIRKWSADIAMSQARTLQPWIEEPLRLPRPEFKRYLPERSGPFARGTA